MPQRRIVKLSAVGLIIATIMGPLFSLRANALSVQEGMVHQYGPVVPYFTMLAPYSGGYYVADTVNGGTFGVDTGSEDAMVRKYDSAGNELWTRQFGTDRSESVSDIDANESGVFVFGTTYGYLGDGHRDLNGDGYVRKYNQDGTLAWTRQFGSSDTDILWAGSVDATGIYMVGDTYGSLPGYTNQGGVDAYVVKYDLDGNLLWQREFGTDSEYDDGYAVYAGAGGVYVAGSTGYNSQQALGASNIGGGDAYIRKYDTDGNVVWTQQFGSTEYEQIIGITSDGTDIYASGESYGSFDGSVNAGGGDMMVAKFSTSGVKQWSHEVGSSEYDTSYGIAADSTGVYISGLTWGTLPGQTSAGGEDAVVQKYTTNGDNPWTYQFGTSGDDQGDQILADAVNGVVVAGFTNGTFPGQTRSAGDYDSFHVSLTQDDSDSDSIFNAVDTSARTYSNDFSDGTSYGSIVTRGDQTLTIQDAPSTTDGVLVTAAAGGGATPAQIQMCGGIATTNISAGDSATLTCGSAIIRVLSGTVETTFTATDGTVGTVSLDSGNKVTFKPETSTFIADTANTEPVVVAVDGTTVTVQPGTSKKMFIPVTVDIKPGSSQNTINLSSNGVIPVAILTTPSFNAANVDPLSINLEGASVQVKGKSGNAGSLVDVDGDGDLDLLVQVSNTLQLLEGSTSAKLTGLTKDGIPIGGSDLVSIVP